MVLYKSGSCAGGGRVVVVSILQLGLHKVLLAVLDLDVACRISVSTQIVMMDSIVAAMDDFQTP